MPNCTCSERSLQMPRCQLRRSSCYLVLSGREHASPSRLGAIVFQAQASVWLTHPYQSQPRTASYAASPTPRNRRRTRADVDLQAAFHSVHPRPARRFACLGPLLPPLFQPSIPEGKVCFLVCSHHPFPSSSCGECGMLGARFPLVTRHRRTDDTIAPI